MHGIDIVESAALDRLHVTVHEQHVGTIAVNQPGTPIAFPHIRSTRTPEKHTAHRIAGTDAV